MNKRQRKNRRTLRKITIASLLLEMFLSFGIAGNIDLAIETDIKIIAFYIINTIISICLLELCNYAKIKF